MKTMDVVREGGTSPPLEGLTLAVIGVGNMGGALCRGVVRAGLLEPGQVVVSDADGEKVHRLHEELAVKGAANNRQAAQAADLVLLAVKPQVIEGVLRELGDLLGPERLVVSIAAGVSTARIGAHLPTGARVVRAMPNTPILVGAGAVGLVAGEGAGPSDIELARRLFAPLARVVVLDREDLLDAVTAVSGSGPAYVFYLVEAMVTAGVAEGLSEGQALELARRTVLGAGRLLEETGADPAELRRQVTSPGGTTEAAIGLLEREGVRDLLVAAVRRAAERSRELGR